MTTVCLPFFAIISSHHVPRDFFSFDLINQIVQSKTIELQFSDGTSVKAKNAFLNMLPFDLPAIRGLEPWSAALDRYADPGLATKIVLGWNDKTKAPPAMLKITPCVNSEGKGCERLIFSGDNKDGWMSKC